MSSSPCASKSSTFVRKLRTTRRSVACSSEHRKLLCVVMGLLWLVLMLVLLPARCWAWGPITHLAHGAEVLANITIVGGALQRLLRRHKLAYLYGCVGADITQAKKYTRPEQAHCHSWLVGWRVVEEAQSDEERAFAYGYLTHLASDVFSHNHYVPIQLVVSYRSFAFRHIYWEARFDTLQDSNVRRWVRELREREFPNCDALVRRAVDRTLFSFDTDKRIFNTFIAIHDFEQWYRVLHRLTSKSRYPLPPHWVDLYNRACVASTLEMLELRERASNQKADPTGLLALHTAKRVRQALRDLHRRGGALPAAIEAHLRVLESRSDLEAALESGLPTAALSQLRQAVHRS